MDQWPSLTPTEGPRRVQILRKRGWLPPPDTVRVDDATRWGNPFKPLGGKILQAKSSYYGDNSSVRRERERQYLMSQLAWPVDQFRHMLLEHGRWVIPARPGYPCPTIEDIKRELRGKNLATYEPVTHPSAADVLLEIANDWPTPITYGTPPKSPAALNAAIEQMKSLRRR
jgi:hypothetical protein